MPLYDPGTIETGDPEAIRAEADELKTVAATIHTVAEMLRTVSTHGVWESCSGTLFEREVGTTPDDLFTIANRLTDTERIIRPYADRLARTQREMKRKRLRYDEHVKVSDAREAELATMTPEDPEYARVDREYRAAANSREMNKRGYERLSEEGATDEQSMARRLTAATTDGSDPTLYNVFEGASRTGQSSLFNNPVVGVTPWAKAAVVMTAGDPMGKLGRRVVYEEGSYSDVGKTTLLTAASAIFPKGQGGRINDAARASRRADELAAVAPVAKSTSTSWRTKVTHNAKATARHKVATSKIKARHKVEDTLADKTGTRLLDDMAADWAAIAGSGRVRKGAHVITYSVNVADKTTSDVAKVRKAADTVDSATQPDAVKREQEEREEAAAQRQEADRARRAKAVDDLTQTPVTSPLP